MRNLIKIIHASAFLALCSLVNGQGFERLDFDFGFETEEYGGGLSFVDLNNDGLDDLSFATHRGEVPRFLISDGNNLLDFVLPIYDTAEVKQILWVDFNNDGLLDLYLGSAHKNKLYKSLSGNQFEEVSEKAGFSFPDMISYCSIWFDYDKDGLLDLIVAHRNEEKQGRIDLYRNNGDETFTKRTSQAALLGKGESVLAMTTIDYNGDGWEDVFLAQDWEKGNILLENNQNGTFTDVSQVSGIDFKMNSMTATVADVDADGWEDIYVSNTTDGNIFLRNTGMGNFIEVADQYGLGIRNVTFGSVFFDADNDTDLDLHIGGLLSNFTFENENNSYTKQNLEWGFATDKEFNNGVATGDFNNDGYVDIAKSSVIRKGFIEGSSTLWVNRFASNNYLKINLEGSISNKNAIGARIELYINGEKQYRRLAIGESFSSQHSFTQNFGLANHSVVDSVIVYWPSFNVSVLKNIPVNQTISIKEPLDGCTDPLACNFDVRAIVDNGYCRYESEFYDCLGCLQDSDQDGICDEFEVFGCMDSRSCNYDPEATEDNGSCVYLLANELVGPNQVINLEEARYTYDVDSLSAVEWAAVNGSIILGQGTREVVVIWHQEEGGMISAQESIESGCLGEIAKLSVDISPKKDEASDLEFSLGPNPTLGKVRLYNLDLKEEYHFTIYDVKGCKLISNVLNTEDPMLDLSSLQTGIYFLTLKGKQKYFSSKIYKQ